MAPRPGLSAADYQALLKQGLDTVVIDLTGFTAAERRAVFTHLRGLRPTERTRILLQRSRP